MRELVRRLGAEGRTVFLSSHLLGEVEQVCDEVAIVDARPHRRTGVPWPTSWPALDRPPCGSRSPTSSAGAATLERAGLLAVPDGDRIRVDVAAEDAECVTRALVADGQYPTELRPVETSLEDAFFALTDQLDGAQLVTRLVVAELRRIAARRLVRLTVVLAVVGIAAGGLAAFVWSDALPEHVYQQRVAEAKERQVAEEAQIERCLQAHGVTPGEDIADEVARACFPAKGPASADDPRFHPNRLRGVLQGVSGALAVIAWGLGASLVGAEFASRSMTTLLTWETRRGRVFVAKARGGGRRR